MRAVNQNPAGWREGFGCGSGRRRDGFTARPSRQKHVSINEAAACFQSERTLCRVLHGMRVRSTPSVSVHHETAPRGQRARSAWQRPATTAARLGMNGVIRRMASRQHKWRKFSISPNSRLEALDICQVSMHACIPQVRSRPVAPPHSSRVKAGGMALARCGVLSKRKAPRTLMQGLSWPSSLSHLSDYCSYDYNLKSRTYDVTSSELRTCQHK